MSKPTDGLTCNVTRMSDGDWLWIVSDLTGSILRRGFADTRQAARDFARRARKDLRISKNQRWVSGLEDSRTTAESKAKAAAMRALGGDTKEGQS